MAPSTSTVRFLFVPQVKNDTSQKDREVQNADLRAHAARHSHRKRHAKRSAHSKEKLGQGKATKLPSIQAFLAMHPITANVVHDQHSSNIMLSPIGVLGQSKLDPFDTGAIAGLPPMVFEILEFGYNVLWPSLFPCAPSAALSHSLRRRRLGREHGLVLHAHISATYSFILGFHIFRNSPTWPLACSIKGFHETQAMKMIEQEIQTIVGPPSDILLHATLLVGFIPNGPETPSLDCYPASPLAAAQLLNAFGTAKLIPERLQLINHCLSIKGGVNSIAFQGLRDMLRLEDLIRASRTGTKPLYSDWSWREDFIQAMSEHTIDRQALDLSSILGTAFQCVTDLNLLDALSMACTATLALDQYHRGGPNSPRLWNLVRARNAIQWLLCNLEVSSPEESIGHAGLYNVCRLAALIYSDITLFPIPNVVTVKVRLAGDMRVAWESCKLMADQVCDCNSLLTWAAVMGGIAAVSTAHRHWYAALLSHRMAARPLDWTHFKSVLSSFLWWDYVLEIPTRNLWDEAMRLHQM